MDCTSGISNPKVLAALALLMAAPWSMSDARGTSEDEPSWQVVWSDEFESATLDPNKWTAEVSCWGGGNNERQCYTDRPENVQVVDGHLRLIARPEQFTGPLYPAHHDRFGDERRQQDYTSGKVITYGKADWKYGRFSARIKLPAGQGAWPAFWMMPADDTYGAWPLSGEIDIMEAVNLETSCDECPGGIERRTSAALHFGGKAPKNTYLTAMTGKSQDLDPANEWHVFSVEWAEGVIQWFVDGEIIMRITNDDWYTDSPKGESRANAPFDQPFYLLINLAVGGNLPEKTNGRGFDTATFPAELLVDWVRVEECAGDQETGRACLSTQRWDGSPSGPSEEQAS